MKNTWLIVSVAMAVQAVAHAQIHPARTIPLHLAEDAVMAAQKEFPDDRQSRYSFIDSYSRAFLDSLRYGERFRTLQRGSSNDAFEKGYLAGKSAVEGETGGPSISPLDFGYLMRDLEGEYVRGSERSEFIAATTGERFHLNMGNAGMLPPGNMKIRAYVSPETVLGFGHFGGWRREIIVIQVLEPNDE